ncbi:peptidylprolyl isomerase [Phormidium yuhuli AB48]|uniref:peptidylprolyl isomerase n=1 Tax=Phormidium yuhuli AB48 TaxID=2940671 RepID=A0ABY5AQJ1_9CYAN|nr:peptidylprolyl isomerase [Phormidium yuhuli]USR91485.1 peptidylprolyl isomerase [Phormidium yuhuli AB48]
MTDNFITIDDQAISLKQAIGYLNTTGDLPKFIQRILYRHIIEQTLSHRLDVAVEPQQIEQAIVNFRVQNKLTEPAPFEEWLKSQGLTYESFQKRVSESLRVEVLKQKEISQESRKYFNDNKAALDRIVLSRIVVLAQALAKEIQQQLTNGTATFEALAKQHSVTNDSSLGGLMGTLQMGQLPPEIRGQLAGHGVGDIIGPLEVEGRYTILRIEQILPAAYEGDLRKQLEERFFAQWLQNQLKDHDIKLNIE